MASETPTFIDRLRSRHVFRVAAMYAVTAWVLMQIGSVVFAPLGLPAWSQTALIVVVAIGFPIALVLAWIFDVTPDGIVRTAEGGAPTKLGRARRIDFAIIGMLVVALAMALLWKRETPAPAAALTAEMSIAVLPFVAMSEDANLRHLGEGIAEEITNQLAGRPHLKVASRTSAFQSHGEKDATAIATSLGVAYVLEGSVRPSGEKTRLTVQLVRASDGFHVWSETYDLPANATAAQHDEMVSTVSLMVDAQLDLEADVAAARRETANDEALRLYADASRLNMQRRAGGTQLPVGRRIVDLVDKAIALDPNLASAHGMRAYVFTTLISSRDEARDSVDRALALRPDDPRFIERLAQHQMRFDLDLGGAQRSLDRVREIDPNYPFLDESYATLATMRGRLPDALQFQQRAIERNPYNASRHQVYAGMLRIRGDLEGAEREFDTTIRLAPGGFFAFLASWGRIEILLDRGEIERAQAAFDTLSANYRHTGRQRPFGYLLARLGREAEARAFLAEASTAEVVDSFAVFLTYYGLKDYPHALEWLRRAIDERDIFVLWRVRLPNAFPGLQEEPGYAEILRYLDSIQRSP